MITPGLKLLGWRGGRQMGPEEAVPKFRFYPDVPQPATPRLPPP